MVDSASLRFVAIGMYRSVPALASTGQRPALQHLPPLITDHRPSVGPLLPNDSVSAETAMPNLPYELLDHIVDHLEYDHDALGACCLVSKSWIPRTREHLFAWIDFQTRRSPRLQQWKKAFPDSSTSPAHYAKYLAIGCPQLVTEAGGEAGNWIASFSSVEELKLGGWGSGSGPGWEAAFILLHAFSPVLKVLRVDIPSLPFPHIFDLVLSFPLLEDLDLLERPDDSTQTDNGSDSDESPTVVQDAQPSNLPVFTGSLNLFLSEGVKPIVYWLLSSQSGIHFQKLTLGWVCEEDIPLTTELVERCSGTLEYLYISFDLDGVSIRRPRPMGN